MPFLLNYGGYSPFKHIYFGLICNLFYNFKFDFVKLFSPNWKRDQAWGSPEVYIIYNIFFYFKMLNTWRIFFTCNYCNIIFVKYFYKNDFFQFCELWIYSACHLRCYNVHCSNVITYVRSLFDFSPQSYNVLWL